MAEEEMLDYADDQGEDQAAGDAADAHADAAPTAAAAAAAADGGDAAAPAAEAANGGAGKAEGQHADGDKPPQEHKPATKAASPDPDDPMSQPPHGTEVYIANVPMDANDAQLKAFVSAAGEVYQLRLPKNPDGRNRGYGFVVYTTREAAEHAVESLAGQELPDYPGRKVNVRLNESQSKNKLYIGNLPRSYTQLQLEQELKANVVGVETVELMMDKENPTVNRGFAFITFYNYACADAARKKYTETDHTTVGGRPVHVTWAEPKKVEDGSQVRAIFISGLPSTVNEQKMVQVFKVYGEIEKVMLPYSKEDPKKYREYGFVHFRERAGAVEAVTKCGETKPLLDGKELSVALARPQPVDGGGGPGGRGPPGRGTYGSGDRHGGGYGSRGPPRGPYGGRGGDRYGGSGGGRGYHGRYEDAYEEDEYYEGSGGGFYGGGGYGGAAAATGATVMVPVQLPSGQLAYMMVPSAGAAGPVRRAAYGAPYGGSGYGSGGGGGGGGGYRPY